jgi:hypothetical protein
VLLRLTDPDREIDERAPAPYDGFGGAVAYTSPWFLSPDGTPPAAPGSTATPTTAPAAGGTGGSGASLPTTGGGGWTGTALAAGAAALLARRAVVAAKEPRTHTHADGTTHTH